MRTSIFNNFANMPKEFREDFQILWDLPSEKRNKLISKVVEIYKTDISGEHQELLEKAVFEIEGNAPNLLRALKLLLFIYSAWNPIKDEPAEFLKDLIELQLLPSSEIDEASDFLLDFFTEIQKDNDRRLRKIYAGSMLPNYIGITTTVDLRAVIKNPYGSDKPNEDIESYKPECIDFVPVVLVKLRRSSGDPREFKFQLECDDLQLLIKSLKASLKDLESAKDYWSGK